MSAIKQLKQEIITMDIKVKSLEEENKQLEIQYKKEIENLNKELEIVKERNKEIVDKNIIEMELITSRIENLEKDT